MTQLAHIAHYINGAVANGSSTRTQPVYNPATGAVTGNVSLANVADVNAAVAVADEGGADALIAAMESINGQPFGGFNVNFSKSDHAASTFVEMSMLTGDGRVRT